MNATQREGLSDAALALTQPVIDELLKDIARRIKDAGAITDTAEYQIYRAQALGESKQEIKSAVAKQIEAQNDVIDSLFDYIIDKSTPLTANGSLKQIAEAYAKMSRKKTAEQLQNLWADTPQGKVLPIQDAYAKAMDFAFRQVATGALDTETAIRRACAPLAKRGLRTIEQKSGRSVGIEYACRRYLMDQLGQLDDEVQQVTHDELGCDGWEISAHLACAPDHEPIQGRQYSDADYEDLNDHLQRRIGHLNCGHTASPIILGVNAPQYTEEQLQEFADANARGVSYNGQHYTLYEAGQEQSRLENSIRICKRHILMNRETGDSKNLKNNTIRLRVLQNEYAKFCKATGLPTRTERLQTAGFGHSEASKAMWEYKKTTPAASLNKLNFADGVTAEQRESVEKELSVLPQAQREAAERQITRIRFDDSLGGSGYDPRTKEVILSPERQPGDLIHEYGHALERELKIYKDPTFLDVKAQGIDLADKSKIVYDDSTFTEPITLLQSEKFVSAYQGRMYERAGYYVDGKINLDSMKEYFAEGYREFYTNPKNLREHDPALFNYIWRLFYDEK